jgi:predicted ATP-grasp superfamily ATP-dependent carboligase
VQDAGLAIPESLVLQSAAAGDRLLDCPQRRDLFPAVVKPHASIVGGATSRLKTGVAQVADLDACRVAVASLPPEAFPVLVQRRVHGSGEGLFLLRWEGRVVAAFAHRRLREQPPAGGVSVYRESVAPDPALLRAGVKLLELLEWQGVAMIECKRDVATGHHVLMEVNGRLWGSLQLAIDAGVDFPRLLADCVCGRRVPAVTAYRLGVRSRWFWGDVDHLYLRLTRSAEQLHLDGAATPRRAALRNFFRRAPQGEREEIWRWRDPAPFLVETLARFGLLR